MRKILVCLLAFCVLFSTVSGCGGEKKPENMSDTAYRAGQKAVEITEQYLNMDITAREAYDQLETVYGRLEEQKTEEIKDTAVSTGILSLQHELMWDTDDAEVSNQLKKLKEELGVK